MWKSPIEVIDLNPMGEIVEKIVEDQNKQTETYVMEYISKMGINVDKNELIRALQYDRNQYEKGYADGMEMYEFVLHWLADAFDAPCQYTINKQDVSDFIGEKNPDFCQKKCGCNFYECWKEYFRLYKNEVDE